MIDLSSYEWHYFIGGDCGLKHRETFLNIAFIAHIEQGVYEARLMRDKGEFFCLGVFDSPDEAQRIIETTLTNLQEDVCITT